MGFKLGQKFRDLFFVTRDRTRHVLAPGKQYVMTRQGWIEQVERVAAPEEPTEPTDPTDPGTGDGGTTDPGTGDGGTTDPAPVPLLPYDENPNVLIALGAKGDLRQTEIIQRNLSTIFSNSIHKGDLYHTPENFEKIRGSYLIDLHVDRSYLWSRGEDIRDRTSTAISSWGDPVPSNSKRVYRPTGWATGSYNALAIDPDKITLMGLTMAGKWVEASTQGEGYVGFKVLYDGGFPPTHLSVWRIDVEEGRPQERFLRVEEANLIHNMVKEPYHLSLFNEGGIPTGEKLMDFTAPQRLLVPSDTSTILMHADTPPSAAFGLTLKRNGTTFGTLTFNPSGSVSGTITSTWLNKGDRFTIESQNIGEPSMTNLAVTMTLKRDV